MEHCSIERNFKTIVQPLGLKDFESKCMLTFIVALTTARPYAGLTCKLFRQFLLQQ